MLRIASLPKSIELQAILDALPDNVIVQLRDHSVLWVNQAAAGPGRTPSDLLGQKCHEIWHGSATPCPKCPAEECFQTGRPARRTSPTPDGKIWELRAVPVLDEDGNTVSAIKIARDVTHDQGREEERLSLLNELSEKNRELEAFVRTVSHELKSPLVSIGGFAQLLKRKLPADLDLDIGRYLDRILLCAGQMTDLVDSLLSLSRAGEAVGPPQEVAMGKLAERTVQMLQGLLGAKGVAVGVAPDLPMVWADPLGIQQVLSNLLANAAKFTHGRKGARIDVGCRWEGGCPVFTVRDNGMGMAPADLERVFGLFEKVDLRSEGVGLGLAITRRIIEHHGGRIWAESEGPGRGSTFCFTLGDGP